MKVSYSPCHEDPEPDLANSFVKRFDERPPTPKIYSISHFGEVRIRFNETMQLQAALNETELYKPRNAGRRMAVDLGEVHGKRSHNFKNYSKIHAGNVTIDGEVHSGIEVTLLPNDPENSCSDYLGFTWELGLRRRGDLPRCTTLN